MLFGENTRAKIIIHHSATFGRGCLINKNMNTKTKNGCLNGCKYLSGNEIHHHPDCRHYPESMSKRFDEMKIRSQHYKDLWIATTNLIHAIETQNEKKYKKYLNGVRILVNYPSEGF